MELTKFSRVPNSIFKLPLSANEKLILIYLIRLANNNKPVYPALDTIALNCSLHRNTVIKTLKALQTKEFIRIENHPYQSNSYVINPMVFDYKPSTPNVLYKEIHK